MTEPIPDDTTQPRRVWLIAGVLALAVVLVGVGVSFAVLALRGPSAKTQPSFTPAQETSPTPSALTTTTGSTTPSASTTPTSSAGSTLTTTTPPGQIVRAARIAYRLNGSVWVSGEDGSNATAVTTSTTGAFSLSPDGRTLVIMQGSATGAHAVLIDVATHVQASLVATLDLPTWAPDSSWLAYTARSAQGYSIRRVNRGGTGDALVTSGAEPQIAPDGKHIAFTKRLDPRSTDALQVYDTSNKLLPSHAVPQSQGVRNFAWAAGGVLYFAKDSSGTAAGWLGMANRALDNIQVIAYWQPKNPPVSASWLYPSPDGSKVLFALSGEDGNNSRLQIADVAAKKIAPLQTRFDAYPMGWLLDGSAVLYIEGNAPAEATALYRIRLDGTHRTRVVSGAGQ